MLTRERLLEVLDYDPMTGSFTWKARPSRPRWTGRFAGKIAGGPHNGGYVHIGIDSTKYLAHKLAWLAVHGEWPNQFIDHKNLDKKDNRIDNLRIADFAQSSANVSLRGDNTSGYRGVYFNKSRNRWVVYAEKNGVKRQFGSFKEKDAAANAHAQIAKQVYGEFCPEYLRGGQSG